MQSDPKFVASLIRELQTIEPAEGLIPVRLKWGPFDGITLQIPVKSLRRAVQGDGQLAMPLEADDRIVALYVIGSGPVKSIRATFFDYGQRADNCGENESEINS